MEGHFICIIIVSSDYINKLKLSLLPILQQFMVEQCTWNTQLFMLLAALSTFIKTEPKIEVEELSTFIMVSCLLAQCPFSSWETILLLLMLEEVFSCSMVILTSLNILKQISLVI